MDPSSFSNADKIATTNFQLDVTVDFDKSSISGTNTLTFQVLFDGVTEIVLDYQGLDISLCEVMGQDGKFNQVETDTHFDNNLGSAIKLYLTDSNQQIKLIYNLEVITGQSVVARITYATNKDSQAINWLTEEQTTTKKLKYLFTQCEPIHCRSVAPLQDTPSIKTTYSANVRVKDPYVVKMSAEETDPTKNTDGTTTYHFNQAIKIPSYLLAMAVGNIQYQKIGDRTGVISEPGENALDKYVVELKDLETLLDETEKWLTKYIWGKYTILILPASFPFGGMENPLLTFASPTIIVGDGSQVYVATHEIAHSWTGNDVTCRDWSNMWLNEGFTVFEERKVSEILHKDEPDFALLEAQLGNVDLWVDIMNYGVDNSYSSLYPQLNGHSPDDSFSELPYEKGFQFLTYLESLMKTKDDFQDFIRAYILNHQQQSITYLELKAFFESYVTTKYGAATAQGIFAKIDWDSWINKAGKNPKEWNIDFTTDSQRKFEKLADDYIDTGARPANYKDYVDTKDPQLKVIFLNRLTARQNELTSSLMSLIDSDLNCTWDKNPEIGQRWLPLAITMKYEYAYNGDDSGAHYYISWQGRMKYINPIYQQLVRYGRRDLAYKWFKQYQNFYHPLAIAGLKKIIFASATEEENLMLQRAEKAVNLGLIKL
ncbi:peptidase family m1 containing protein [Stylonychia lemnae]|uniref:Peptidase family m1 containing protein n=1 Tax=Stylonychia lemnae TaxID=5949 RepID=A0A077ZR08_STYLE|nr:peptidase family m1 containing protein [Stylonychia lemnae]|eukprot:CDW72343.1 peptidase family m1 containing protein [Stylonychia lemnae]